MATRRTDSFSGGAVGVWIGVGLAVAVEVGGHGVEPVVEGEAEFGPVFLHLFEAAFDEEKVGSVAEETCAFGLEHPAVVWIEGHGSPFDAGGCGSGSNAINRVQDEGVFELAGDAGEDAEVAGTEHEDIHAGDFGDGLGVFERFWGFDLDDDDGVVVGVLEIFRHGHGAVGIVGVPGIDTPFTEGRELAPAHDFGGFFCGFAAGVHDGLGSGFEEAAHAHELAFCGAGDDVGCTDSGCAHEV